MDPVERRDADYQLSEFVLDPENRAVTFDGEGKLQGLDIAAAVTLTSYTLTIEGASTVEITVEDNDLALLNGDLLTGWAWGKNADNRDEAHWLLDGRAVDALLDDLRLRLVRVDKESRTSLKLTFEDRIVAMMRAHSGARKVYRDSGVTRAEFIYQLAIAAGLSADEIWIPELHVTQAVAAPTTDTQRRRDGKPGIHKSVTIEVKHAKATPEQVQNIQDALDAAYELRAPDLAAVAMLCAGTAEGGWLKSSKNPRSTARGPFQILSSTAANLHIKATDVKGAAKRFLQHGFGGDQRGAIKIARQNPHMSPGEIANICEAGSAGAGFYDAWREESQRTVRAYIGRASFDSSPGSLEVQKPFEFARGKNENSWDAGQRLAEEVQWRLFARKGRLWYVSEEYLFAQAPQMALTEGENGVDELTFGIDLGARDLVAELQASARLGRWDALPGMVALTNGQGAADGRWLVHQHEGTLTDSQGTVTLNKPLPVKPEPANETTSVDFGGTISLSGKAAPVEKVLQEAIRISRHNYPYVWGGGHGKIGQPSGGGYDCSGYVSACLHAGGFLNTPLDSTRLESWGEAGRGKYFTVYASSQHTFIVFHGLGKYKRADTSPQGGESQRGPHVRTNDRATSGFVARHAKGL